MFDSFIADIKDRFSKGDFVWMIIVICFLFFILEHTLGLIGLALQNDVLVNITTCYFALPLSFHAFLLKPWTLFTNLFFHRGFGHIFFNLLTLFWFGQIYQLYLNNKFGWKIFIGGGIFGGLLALVAYQFLPFLSGNASVSNLVGASGGIEAIIFAVTAVNPEHEINLLLIGRVRLKYIALFSLLLNYLGIAGANSAGVIAHLGGAGFGFLYMKQIQNGFDLFGFTKTIKNWFQPKSKLKVSHNEPFNKVKTNVSKTDEIQERLDLILDKINQSGYDSLSKEEKAFLFQYSNSGK